jgi:hypothetical protein
MALTIKEAIQNIVKNEEEIYSLIGVVAEVDESKRTTTVFPIDGSAQIYDVKLQANESGTTGLVQIPTEGSEVVVKFLSKETAFVSLCTEVDKVLIDTEEITINGGSNGGLININDLITKINTVENDLNSLKLALTSWVPVPNDGGAALKAATATYSGQTLTPTVVTDLEDTKITH